MTRFPILAVGGVLAICAGGCSVDDEDEGPDLQIIPLPVTPRFPVAGGTFTVSFRVINEGTRSATASTWRMSLGTTEFMGMIPALNDGESFTFSNAFTATDPSRVTVSALVDSDDVVDETNEGNNTGSALVTIGDTALAIPAGG